MCDLHLNTLPHPTPRGAIARQIAEAQSRLPESDWIKLYNSGNWFDPASIPPDDYEAIIERLGLYERVIVENHPGFGWSRHQAFLDRLGGVSLEVAVGLESVQPRQLKRLGKKMSRDDFDRYSKFLMELEVSLRVFLIFGAPHQSIAESRRWARLSARHASACGARHVSLIPARAGNGWNGQSGALPRVSVEDLRGLMNDVMNDVGSTTCVSVDLWDVKSGQLSTSEMDCVAAIEAAAMRQESRGL